MFAVSVCMPCTAVVTVEKFPFGLFTLCICVAHSVCVHVCVYCVSVCLCSNGVTDLKYVVRSSNRSIAEVILKCTMTKWR